MSPIGRVFIVLNLILAGVFVGFAGTYLQKQHHWKTEATTAQKATEDLRKTADADKVRLTDAATAAENAKISVETKNAALQNDLDRTREENQQLTTRLSSLEGDVKALRTTAEAGNTEAKAAFAQAKAAYDMAIAAETAKNEAVNGKNASDEENRKLKNDIAALNATVTNKDVQIADLNKKGGELQLMVDVAQQNGFLASMAQPKLAGTVSAVQGKLLTISISDNPTSAEIKAGLKFAIYDASGYKGEARVTDVDATKNIAFATMDISTGTVKQGDSASTRVGTH
jgi:hypothetical protein